MFALRCTAKLLNRLEAKPVAEPALATTHLGHWVANVVVLRRRHLVVAVSERTLLPVILDAAPSATLPERLRASVSDVLRRIGIEPEAVAAELVHMEHVVIAKTARNRVLGSLNEFCQALDFYLEDGDTNLLDVAVELADTICSPLGWETPKTRTRAQFDTSTSSDGAAT